MFTDKANKIFQDVIEKYHVINTVDQPFENPYNKDTQLLEHLLYRKSWIDTVQWHYEDIIRDPQIDPVAALKLKRQIDASNQDRTDMVEYIDSYFLEKYKDVTPKADATINTESPAWGIDRLSILALKVYHMNEEATRTDASDAHIAACTKKLDVLLEQRVDLSTAIDTLLNDIENGDKYMKVYKQMKMYNDDELNPVLRSQK
jgi:type II secretory ATPase GspE/PulE/Tfp pilus assembly ATPase PilB-like protein